MLLIEEKMLKIYNLEERQEYIKEIVILTQKEWGKRNLDSNEYKNKIIKKVKQIKELFNDKNYCKLILLDGNNLVGFISIFPKDGEERKDLSPWYATMYVKEQYRGRGYSKILNDAILDEAKKRKIKRLYLKTELINYYEKFGAKYMGKLNEKEKIYYFDLS